jgi:preprotein translocase subunit YajC
LTASSTVSYTIAQTSQPTSAPAARPPKFLDIFSSQFFPIFLGIIVLYAFMWRTKRKQEKQRKAQFAAMKRGDRVVTAGGILGKIVEVEDGKILVKVDENSNTKIWFTREAIRRVLTEEKAEATK